MWNSGSQEMEAMPATLSLTLAPRSLVLIEMIKRPKQ